MPTNTIKHRMLVEARKIASTIFEDRVEKVKNLSTLEYSEYIIPACVVRNDHINSIIQEHPEFDEDIFRGMIRTFETRNKEGEYFVYGDEDNEI